jgi:hypothetical protein
MIAVIVPPSPVLFLFPGRKLTEVAVRIVVGFGRPTVVVDNFVGIPHVIIGVVRIVNAIVMRMSTCNPGYGACKCGG